jgi:hypothetical protein
MNLRHVHATSDINGYFQSYGALGFSHPTGDNDGGSNQFFWFKYDQGLVAPVSLREWHHFPHVR